MLPPCSSLTPSDDSDIPPYDDKYNIIKRKHRSAHLSDSFHGILLSSPLSPPLTPSSNQQESTDSFGIQLSSSTTATTRSGYSGSKDGRLRKEKKVSGDHKAAQDEWEEFAVMVNVQKCMCKTGWMVGGVQHLRGKEGIGKGFVF